MKKFFKEFGAFITKGNILDLAVGIIIGGAFQKIVSSLVKDIIMPLISMIGGVNIATAKWVLKPAEINQLNEIISPEIALMYGSFLQTVIDFLIIGFSIFVALKIMTRFSSILKQAKEKIVAKIEEEKEESAQMIAEKEKKED